LGKKGPANRIISQGWGLRRLERSRRTLLDKWNEINNQAEDTKASRAS